VSGTWLEARAGHALLLHDAVAHGRRLPPYFDRADRPYKEQDVDRIREYYEKALSYGSSDPEVALATARKAAEALCQQLFREQISPKLGKITLESLIARLARDGVLPPHVVDRIVVVQS
jgi:hypothetical protein